MTRRGEPLTVAIVTGTRAEFGLLCPVIDAVRRHKRLRLRLIAAGAHFLPPARTIREVRHAYPVAAEVRMQQPGKTGRGADAEALGRGVSGFARAFARLKPDWVVVLGDRIEAFAAASAASVAGIAVCHIHGGDRAEGIADEAMRHAITKLSHLHCAATKLSGERIVKLGERPENVHVTGSPAIDGLDKIKPMSDAEAQSLGDPRVVALLHPSGLTAEREEQIAHSMMYGVDEMAPGPVLCLAPNHDPGRNQLDDILWSRVKADPAAVQYEFRGTLPRFVVASRTPRTDGWVPPRWTMIDHLPRDTFISLLKRLSGGYGKGLLIGNSSAGMIEAQALGIPVVNIGPRQGGRERGDAVVDVSESQLGIVGTRIDWALSLDMTDYTPSHPFGDGHAGPRIAALLARVDPRDPALLRKHNAY